ncbi:DUF1524 domain-containing protein [Cryobacterium frigoriphilum]|uniref:DUF1524 domain-containing protein n=1 Tax=Cryobacterium frigoriphilum TaxID=1259150 RepID=A0A4R9A2Z8_9MICO|nr:DUF1524 domain-containing protein [Cryobacterium frigoriphilum]TFD50573.1 DUF1524 domain-containing protein [Cryobacterium frigoriphilum]
MRSRHALALFSLPLFVISSLAITSPAVAAETSAQIPVTELFAEVGTASPVTSGYSRDLFTHWIDADGDGCDTRQEVLIEESLVPVTFSSGCTVSSGEWYSWYDGATWTAPSDVDVDHFVPLSEAWQSGAHAWSADQRRAFANDLGLAVGLEAVTDNVNQSKGDRDPGAWLPPLADQSCRYVAEWVVVKYRWALTVDIDERAAMDDILVGACANTIVTVPARGGSEDIAPEGDVPANPQDSRNCTDFASWREAQDWFEFYFPHYGDVARLDSNGDGIACESLPGAP